MKNSSLLFISKPDTRLSGMLVLLMLCLSIGLTGQASPDLPPFPKPGESMTPAKQKSATAAPAWKAETAENKEEGKISLELLSSDNGVHHINYLYEKTSLPNPYRVNHDYYIHKTPDAHWAVDMDAFMDPLDLYVDEAVELKYNGDDVRIPIQLASRTELGEFQGFYTMSIDGIADFNSQFRVAISNFTVIEKVSKRVDGKEYEAYVITYDYYNDILSSGTVISTKNHKVSGYLIPELGFIQESRSGINDMISMKINHSSTSELTSSNQ